MHHLGQKLYTSSTDALLAPATFNDLPLAKLSNDSFLLFQSNNFSSGDVAACVAMNRWKVTIVSWESLCFAEWIDPHGRCNGDRCVCSFTQITWPERENVTWTFRKTLVVDKTASEAFGENRCAETGSQVLNRPPYDIWINSLSDFMFTASIVHVSRTRAWMTILAGKWTMVLKVEHTHERFPDPFVL